MLYFDVVIIGAGPAGCAAALRLRQLGYSVAMVERYAFPRAQIGESLSPGVWPIMDALDIRHSLEHESFITDLDARVRWDDDSERVIASSERGPGIMVDRAVMDKSMLDACQRAGVQVYQPAQVVKQYRGELEWHVVINGLNTDTLINCGQIFNATGKAGPKQLVYTAPRALVFWTDIVRNKNLPNATVIEALTNGWLWAAPIANGGYRLMVYTDNQSLKSSGKKWLFTAMLRESHYFSDVLPANFELHSCVSQSYFNANSWQPQLWHIGDSAFCLDPLSSTGVEKSLRFALHACTCYHTIMKTQDVELAHEFYQHKLMQTIVTHTRWTQDYYARSFLSRADDASSFWTQRSNFYHDGRKFNEDEKQAFVDLLNKPVVEPKPLSTGAPSLLRDDLHRRVVVDKQVNKVQLPCVVNETLKRKKAIEHPGLIGATAYVANAEISPLLDLIVAESTVSSLLADWSHLHGATKAQQVMLAMLDAGVLAVR